MIFDNSRKVMGNEVIRIRKTKSCTEVNHVPQIFWMTAEENCLRGKLIIKKIRRRF